MLRMFMKLRILKKLKYSELFDNYLEEYYVQEYASPFWPLPAYWQTLHTAFSFDSAVGIAKGHIAKSKRQKPDTTPKVVWGNEGAL